MMESDRVLVEILVAAPIDTVWRALRDPEELRRWFGWEYAGLAEGVDLIFGPETVASDADHTLRFGGMPDRYTLEAHGNHTIVRLIRSRIRAGRASTTTWPRAGSHSLSSSGSCWSVTTIRIAARCI